MLLEFNRTIEVGKTGLFEKNKIKLISNLELLQNFISLYQIQDLFTNKYYKIMQKYVCDVCGWEYDPAIGVPEAGIEPGTPFEELPEDFECPLCGVGKDQFSVAE